MHMCRVEVYSQQTTTKWSPTQESIQISVEMLGAIVVNFGCTIYIPKRHASPFLTATSYSTERLEVESRSCGGH